jgi:hypothetical protein
MMIYRRRRRAGIPVGFMQVVSASSHRTVFGSADGDFIRLRDEYGNEWRGVAEVQSDDMVHYRFRNEEGHHVSGISDGAYGIILRDERGKTWRGFID